MCNNMKSILDKRDNMLDYIIFLKTKFQGRKKRLGRWMEENFATKPHVHVTATWVHLQTYADAIENGAVLLMMIAYAVMMAYVDKKDLTALNVPIETV